MELDSCFFLYLYIIFIFLIAQLTDGQIFVIL